MLYETFKSTDLIVIQAVQIWQSEINFQEQCLSVKFSACTLLDQLANLHCVTLQYFVPLPSQMTIGPIQCNVEQLTDIVDTR